MDKLAVPERMLVVVSIVAALATVFAFISQSNPILSWILAGVALVAVIAVLYKPLSDKVRQRERNKNALSHWPKLLEFELRFRDFLNFNREDTLRLAVSRLYNNNVTNLAKIFPSEFLTGLFNLVEERHNRYPARTEADFSLAVREFQQLVWLYNRDYVIGPLERLGASEWKGKIPEHEEKQIEFCRERWTRFLEGFELFLKGLNKEFGDNKFMSYFEPPKKL